MKDYRALIRSMLDEMYRVGLVNPRATRSITTGLEDFMKTDIPLHSEHEARIVAATAGVNGIYLDWMLGYWISDGSMIWWSCGHITKCKHSLKKPCTCPKQPTAYDNLKSPQAEF